MCDATLRTSKRASQLALATPGGGHIYAGRPVGGVVRLLLETLIFAILAIQVLGTTNPWRVAVVVAAGCGLLGLVKIHGAWSARLLARRAGAITVKAETIWRWVVPIGLIVSIAVLLLPLAAVGALEESVDWDLIFVDSSHGWQRVTTGPDDDPEANETVRAVWSDGGGRRVEIRAWPFTPFRSAARVHRELVRDLDAETTPRLFWGLPVVSAENTTAGRGTLVTALVVDPTGRDVHSLSIVAAPGHEEESRDLLAWLLDRAVLVEALNPD